MPYIVQTASAPAGSWRWGHPGYVALIEVDPGVTSVRMISERCRDVRRIVERSGKLDMRGSTRRSEWVATVEEFESRASHLNFMERAGRARRGKKFLADLRTRIAAEDNATRQHELIDRYGGLEAYMADVDAERVHADETGTLWRVPTASEYAEPIVVVEVTCPSTGHRHILRVPPATGTAREGVAWTFGLRADEYLPTAQA